MKPITLPEDTHAQLHLGVSEATASAIALKLIQNEAASISVVLTHTLKSMESWRESLGFLNGIINKQDTLAVQLLPELTQSQEADSLEAHCDLITTLTAIRTHTEGSLTILTTPAALLQACPSHDAAMAHSITLKSAQTQSFKDLTDTLAGTLGYAHEAVCEMPGEFAIRGGLIDVYPLNAPTPYRIDFFGDTIESIRPFDPTTQRSEGSLETLVIAGLNQKENASTGNFLDYLPERTHWILHEPARLEANFPDYFQKPERIKSPKPSLADVFEKRGSCDDRWDGLANIEEAFPFFPEDTPKETLHSESLELHRPFVQSTNVGRARLDLEQEARLNFLRKLVSWQEEGYQLFLVTHNASEQERLQEILEETPELKGLAPQWHEGFLSHGFLLSFDHFSWPGLEDKKGIVVVTSNEIFGRYRQHILGTKKRRMPLRSNTDQLLDFSELIAGDPLVHLQHGICLYQGLQQLEIQGSTEEVISLEFDGNTTLHVRLHDAHLLSRYVGLTKTRPKLAKLGSNAWKKTRKNAEQGALDFAAELLRSQAERSVSEGHAFAADNHWQQEFEGSFLFQETPGQLTAIQTAKKDMEQSTPMDRLLCGDVGFGKTEVAIRTAFKAVMDGKQVAILIPTTVLCQQHFTTFKERMADYPIVVEMLSRFRKPAQRKKIAADLKSGKIDIIVGTHSLLSSTISFADLGLLVIDEEHRFGVRQKEKIKQLREGIDVLSMSATPIPRTLHMALMGVRSLSVIETPPQDRLPIETLIKHYDPELVKKAIRLEIERGGQIFYLHNRVQTIDAVALRLQEFFPELRIAVGHGQMDEKELEQVMTEFVRGEYDILVCTTIIESGLDIPNCNTLIIEGADKFGLAQLYQLRGRVGRFTKQAYAYLLLHEHKALVEEARKRLSALREYNQLGAGFRIAMRDLELRGAGNLLGAQQSGHIAGVGFDLYCQLLRQSIAGLKGEPQAKIIRAHVRLNFITEGEAKNDSSVSEARIPPSYIPEARLRIDTYRQLALSENKDSIKTLEESLIDRFGPLPEAVELLLGVTEIRCLAESKGIGWVGTEENKLKCQYATPGEAQYLKIGNRFPRLTAKTPLLKMKEIKAYLHNLK